MKARWWLGALLLTSELLIVGTHLDQAKNVYRVVYNSIWSVLPKPAGYDGTPGRFAPR